jgi:hypothetical protein
MRNSSFKLKPQLIRDRVELRDSKLFSVRIAPRASISYRYASAVEPTIRKDEKTLNKKD